MPTDRPRREQPLPDHDRHRSIVELIRRLPEGYVVTYGDLCPEAPRLPGRILALNEDPELPWHRVVRADGSFAQGERQRRRLHEEGVPFAGKRVDMEVAHLPREALAELR